MVQTPYGLERFAGSNALLAIASALGADNNSAATDLRGSVAILVQLLDSEAISTSNVSALLSACPNGSETHLQEQTAADVLRSAQALRVVCVVPDNAVRVIDIGGLQAVLTSMEAVNEEIGRAHV